MIPSSEQTTWRSRIRPLAFCSIYPSRRSARSLVPWLHPRPSVRELLRESSFFNLVMPVSQLIGVVLRPSNDHRGRTRRLGGHLMHTVERGEKPKRLQVTVESSP